MDNIFGPSPPFLFTPTEESQLLPNSETARTRMTVISEEAMTTYTQLGMEMTKRQYNEVIYSAGPTCCFMSTVMTAVSVVACFFPAQTLGLIAVGTTASALGCGCGLGRLSIGMLYAQKSIVDLFDEDGSLRPLTDPSGKSLLYYAVKDATNDNYGYGWCRYLLRHGALTQYRENIENSPLRQAIRSGNWRLIDLLIEKSPKEEIDEILRNDAHTLRNLNRVRSTSRILRLLFNDLDQSIPELHKMGKFQNRLKWLGHAFEIKGQVAGFDFEQYNPIQVGRKFEKYYSSLATDVLQDVHSPEVQKLILDSLKSTKQIFKLIKPEVPVLINIGHSGHAAYLWLWHDFFALVDTGGLALTNRLFEQTEPAIIGKFDRTKLTLPLLEKIYAANKLGPEENLTLLRECLYETLDLGGQFHSFIALFQAGDHCSYRSLMTCLACMAYVAKHGIEINHPQQIFEFFLFSNLMPLHIINTSKLFQDNAFCTNPEYLPFLRKLEDGCTTEFNLKALNILQENSPNNRFAQTIYDQYVAARTTLAKVISQMEKEMNSQNSEPVIEVVEEIESLTS